MPCGRCIISASARTAIGLWYTCKMWLKRCVKNLDRCEGERLRAEMTAREKAASTLVISIYQGYAGSIEIMIHGVEGVTPRLERFNQFGKLRHVGILATTAGQTVLEQKVVQ